MSFIQQTTNNLREAFASMPMQSRVIAVLLVAAIGVGLGFLVRGGSTSGGEYLFGGKTFGEAELDEVELAFSRAGLNGWTREGRRLRIPAENRNEYYAALEDSATLPLAMRSHLQNAIKSNNPLESNEQRISREMHAKEQDLGAKITQFPDVRNASVEYDRGERRGLSASRPQSASVVVTPEGLDPLSRVRVQQIKELIRGSFAGMSIDDVVVIDTNAGTSPTDADDSDPMLKKRRETESMVEQKIRSMLRGYGEIRVAAYAEIDPTMNAEKSVLKFDPERTTTNESSRKSETTSNRPLNQGVPGVTPNALGNRPQSIENESETNKTKDEERESNGVVGQQFESSQLASLAVKRISVSIGLPSSFYQRIWPQIYLRKNPDKDVKDVPVMQASDVTELKTETENNIKAAVSPLLPDVAVGEDKPQQLVKVFEYPDLPESHEEPSQTAGVALTWLANSWQSLAMVGLALIALLIAHSAMRSTPTTPAEFSEGFGLVLPTPPPEPEQTDAEKNDKMTITGGSLKDELVVIVESNPEVAANVIRAWVGEAA
jgi:flagellar M-ring protein FliF